VQVVESKLPFEGSEVENVTVPVGKDLLPGEVSVTVATHWVGALTGSGVSEHSTIV
jgi:hypothetical protein